MADDVRGPLGNMNEEAYYEMKAHSQAHLAHTSFGEQADIYIDTLVELADALGVDDLSFSSYSAAIARLDEDQLSVARSLLYTQHAEVELSRHLAAARHEDALIQKWLDAARADSDVTESVPALERRKAALTAKGKEYRAELDVLMSEMPQSPPMTITELAAFRKQLKADEQVLKEKRAKVEAFQGLPPNLDLARHALQEARQQQMDLIQLRERLLGRMADGVK